MATTYLALLDGVVSEDAFGHADHNKITNALDRQALMGYSLWAGGRNSGWGVTSGTSTIAAGAGQVGPCWCVTGGAQAVSGLASGQQYVFAQTDVGSPASGTVDFVARGTSAAITNADGITNAVLLGGGNYMTSSGFTSVDTGIRDNWTIDHGGLSGLSDDDHPEYMQDRVVVLLGEDVVTPGTSGASTSSYGTNFPATAVNFPALSTTEMGWQFYTPPDYSGTVVIHTDWISTGLAGPIRLGLFARNRDSGETWDAALTSCAAAEQLTISGSNGQLMRYSHAWSASLPAQEDRGVIAVRRVGANGSDTMSGTARLLSARLVFETGR